MAKQEEKVIKTEPSKEVSPTPETTVKKEEAPLPVIQGEEAKPEPTPDPVTKDATSNTIEVSGETILNGGKDDFQKSPVEGIDEKLKESKDTLDTQKKAEASIKDGSSGLDPISVAEIQNGLVKDYNSDRPVYETNSAYLSAMKASGKLAGE